MKKIKTNKKGIRVRAELSSIAGFGDRGFHDNGVKEVENIFISKEGLKLRDGICKAAALPGEIIFAQQLTVQSTSIGFVSDTNALYAVYPTLNNSSYCTFKKVFSHPVNKTNGFLFALGKKAYLYYNDSFYVLGSSGFVKAGIYSPTFYTTSYTVTSEQMNEYTNLLSSGMRVCISFTEESRFVFFGENISAIKEAVLDDVDVLENISFYKNKFVLPYSANKGSTLYLTVVPEKVKSLIENGILFNGCSSSLTGDAYACNDKYIFKLSEIEGKLMLYSHIFESPAENIRTCFTRNESIIIAVGNSIGLVSDGKITCMCEEFISENTVICDGDSFIYVETPRGIAKIKESRENGVVSLSTVKTFPCLTGDGSFMTESIVYSPGYHGIFVIGKNPGDSENQLYYIEDEGKVWTRISGVDNPSFCFTGTHGLFISSGSSLFFMTPFESCDRDGSTEKDIEGCLNTCELDFFTQADKKRLLSASASVSGRLKKLNLRINADNGRSDFFEYLQRDVGDGCAFPVCRMNAGSFSFANVSISFGGKSASYIHDIYFDIKTLD